MRFLVLTLMAGSLAAQSVSFVAPRTFTGTLEPSAVVTGDFNNDGLLDILVTADGYDFFAGAGNGVFQVPRNTPNGGFNQTVAADFNRDGKLDLASIQTLGLTGAVYVSLGRGDGTFGSAVVYSVPNIATSIAAGDFNNDGIADLAVSNGNLISVLLGRGDGTFAELVNSPANAPYAIAAAHLNGGGNLDLAAIDSGYMQALLGDGRGSFTPGAKYFIDTSPEPSAIAVADLRHIGITDVVVAATDQVFVFLGNGNGTFQPVATDPVFDGNSVAIADVNGDGHADLLVGNYYSDGVSVLLGNGDGTFQPQVFAGAGQLVQGVAAGDFNGSGISGFVAINQLSSSITVFPGSEQARFNAPTVPLASANAIVAANFNAGRTLDFAAANISLTSQQSQVAIYLGDGRGGFKQSAAATVPSVGWLVAGDFNGDGQQDVVAISSNSITVLPGNGKGQLGRPRRISVAHGLGTAVAADLNRDGKLDLAIAVTYGNQLAILLGNGDATFQSPRLIPLHRQPYGVAAADLNGDHIADLIVTCQNSAEVAVLLGNGDGSFAAPFYYTTGATPQYVAVGDLNGDGIPDLAVSNSSSNTITLLLGYGDGTFRPGGNVAACPIDCYPRQLEIMDLNGDGRLDIAVAAQETNSLAVLAGNGDGTFAAPQFFGTGTGPFNMVSGRFSGGQLPDVLVVNGPLSAIAGISILVNVSGQTTSP